MNREGDRHRKGWMERWKGWTRQTKIKNKQQIKITQKNDEKDWTDAIMKRSNGRVNELKSS